MFSVRTRWDLVPNRLSRLLAERRRSRARILDLTETNPTQVGLQPPRGVLELLADPAGLSYAPTPLGALETRAMVAGDFARRGVPIAPERVVLTASTSEAYAFLFKLLCDPGDEVLVPEPGYPLFDYLAGLDGVAPRSYPLRHDGEWHLDTGALRDAVTSRTRAIVVVNPGNPTGSFLKSGEASGLEALAAERGLSLVSDEVFADYSFTEDPRRVSSLATDGPVLKFTLGGLSKSCGLPQLKLGWIAVTGPTAARDEALERLEVVADTYLSVSTPVQLAALRLLARQEELRAPIASRVRDNLARVRAAIGPDSPATLLAPEGGWSAVLRVPATEGDEERAVRLLRDRDVLVHPGTFYGFADGAHLVLSLLVDPGVLADGLSRVLEDVVL